MGDVCHLALSFGIGPNPYPRMINDFQMLLGYETELQLSAKAGKDRHRTLVASVNSEADSIGFMLLYLKRPEVDLYYSEPEPSSRAGWGHIARLRAYHGARREHAWLRATERITHVEITNAKAREAQEQVKSLEDVTVGLEDARAIALASQIVRTGAWDRDIVILVA